MDERATESDAILLQRVQAGQSECFAELVRRYQPALARVARSRLGRNDWAEDVVQETFLAVFKSCDSYDPRYNFRTWLWTILLNQCRAHYQRRMRRVSVETLDVEREESLAPPAAEKQAASPLAALLAKERAAALEALLGKLSTVQADALRLRFFAGLKFHEIAEAMPCSLNTAKARVRTGLERMAALIESAGTQGASPGDAREEH
ncbi:MAG: sigma-70 family RNA polymerase sigma factor [Pirellulales bacterium]